MSVKTKQHIAAAFEHAVAQQTQAYHFKETPSGAWLFKCEDYIDLSAAIAGVLEDDWQTPDGWVLVPREPTDEMVDAARGFLEPSTARIGRAAYRAMLETAPSPPQSRGVRAMDKAMEAYKAAAKEARGGAVEATPEPVAPPSPDIAGLVDMANEEAAYIDSARGYTGPLSTPTTLRDLATALQRVAQERDAARETNRKLNRLNQKYEHAFVEGLRALDEKPVGGKVGADYAKLFLGDHGYAKTGIRLDDETFSLLGPAFHRKPTP